MTNLSILFGVCGIGRGHIYEMSPIIEHYVSESSNRIVILAFGVSYPYFRDKYASLERVNVFEVFVPWIHGSLDGIDYGRTAQDKFNHTSDYFEKNFTVMDKVKDILGRPNIVISDYEPISAMYAYSVAAPLVTIDQQSKYLFNGYNNCLNGLTPWEERSRLGMFFPRVDLRLISSFFKLPSDTPMVPVGNFQIYGSVIRDQIVKLKGSVRAKNENVLVYLSPYSKFVQTPEELLRILKELPTFKFYLFISRMGDYSKLKDNLSVGNVFIEEHGDKNFIDVLEQCRSVICTAGHTFLSELMFLKKPVLAVPLRTYEQQYSAWVIDDGRFGSTANFLTVENISNFLSLLDVYEKSINNNQNNRLYPNPAQDLMIDAINNVIESSDT